MVRLISAFFLFLILPLHAQAQAINAEGVEKLRVMFQNMLDYQKNVNKAFVNEVVDIVYEGELVITPNADHYAITFPRILLKDFEQNENSKNQYVDLGIMTLQAKPDEKPGYWNTIINMPDTISLYENDKTVFEVTLAEQRNIVTFNEKLGYMTKMNINLSGISFKLEDEDIGIALGGIQSYMKYEENEAGNFTGPGHFLLSNLNIAPADSKDKIKIGELKIDFSMSDAKLPTLKQYQEKVVKLAELFNTIDTEEGVNTDDINPQQMLSALYDLYNFEMNGFSFAYSAKNIDVTTGQAGVITGNTKDKVNNIILKSAHIGLSAADLKSEKGSFNIATSYDELSMNELDENVEDTLPKTLNLNLTGQNIPYTSLAQMAKTTIDTVIKNPDNAQGAMFGILLRLPALLGQAGTQLVMENNGIKNNIYDIVLDGKVATDLTSLVGFKAQMNAVFAGLDEMLTKAKAKAENPEDAFAAQAKKFADKLEKMKAVGKTTTKDGKAAYQFDLETTPQGQILVNGQDASVILQ